MSEPVQPTGQPTGQPSSAPAVPPEAGETEHRPGPGAEAGGPTGGRRVYSPPRLECHGNLAEVTRFGGSQILDSGGGLGQQF